MNSFRLTEVSIPGYKKIVEFQDSESGLLAFVAIHNTNLGPALGGTRIFNYPSKKTALDDALQLSRAMTYKCAMAGLPFGGGKGVIITNPNNPNIKQILKSYALGIKKLKGEFYTGEDVGLTEEQVQYMLQFCDYFIGKSHLAGDPSPYAALSAFSCIQEVLKANDAKDSLKGKTFAIKGAGKTGSALLKLLLQAGAKVCVTDINKTRLAELKKAYPSIEICPPQAVMDRRVNVYCPCALGNDITLKNLKNLKAKIVIGTANNQLSSPKVAQALYKRGILHVPDYIANAGGLIDVANELLPGPFSKQRVMANILLLKSRLRNVLDVAEKEQKSPDEVADELAEQIFHKPFISKVYRNIKKTIEQIV